MLVAHSCNPSYSGGRDQEGLGQIVHKTLSQKKKEKKTLHIKGLVECGVAQDISPEFKTQYHKKQKQKQEINKSQSILL
jgi:hypothetical protein